MKYRVMLSPHARRALDRLRGEVYKRVEKAIDKLAQNPRPKGCVKLSRFDEWRIRVGSFRIRYLIDDKRREVIITRIAHRREVYRG